MKIINAFRLFSFYGDNHVSSPYSGSLRGTFRIDPNHLNAVIILQIVQSGQAAIQRPLLGCQTEESATHPSVDKYFRYNPYGGVGRDGKTDPLGYGYYGCIYADHPSPGIDKRTTGISRIERSRMLYDVLN
jgi:hypothetical protein